MKRRIALTLSVVLAVAALLSGLPGAPVAAEPKWQTLDAVDPGDAALAQQAAAPFWGDDPTLWPDWLDVRAVRIPASGGMSLLVVRVPWHAPCGQYGLSVLGPVTPDRTRVRLGSDFCAGELGVIPVEGLDLPDLVIREGRVLDPATGTWNREDRRIRWVKDRWMLVTVR